ncbi:hypothetical protein [Candidatus Thiodictyon syntrophicum]|jgi:hypothetical protein|uniref:Uncharacterized protein n=1 Tax=Candidatus Thiodictyon syntrophicum TaxID=1166950 RepID=A0A2K8UDB4_9GAMM|nr:hypothetical protein [Candidatus Thiodictyon syntrophicum]AUB83556.1 hypothetical protein THSYN_23160 [Candidatus Thiodictyon syntrophicum]
MIDDPTPRLRAWIIANLLDGRAWPGFDDNTDLIADGLMDSLAIMIVASTTTAYPAVSPLPA